MADRLIKFFKGPAFLEVNWTTANPFLKSGEIGYVLENGEVTKAKVGPGYWNDLGWFGQDYYLYDEIVTNIIGDAQGNLNNKTAIEILHLMLNPYQTPLVTNLVNNAGGGFVNETLLEIGQSVAGPVLLNFIVQHPEELATPNGIRIEAGGMFSNEGDYPNEVPISLLLPAPYSPIAPVTRTINVRTLHTKGVSAPVTTKITHAPKLIWGISGNTSMPDSASFNAVSNKQTRISSSYQHDYSFTGLGYSWIGLPGMLAPSNLTFTDVTDPNAPAGYSMLDMGSLVVNNGVGTYLYQLFRSEFYILSPSILRIRTNV